MVVGEHVLVDLRPVDVDVDDFGVGCEGGGVGGHPVGEAAADGDEQIALVGGEIGGVGAVHTDHAGEQPVIAGAGAAAHDGGGHRSVEPLDKGAELGHSSLGADDPAAHQHQGLPGPLNEIQQGLNVPRVGLGSLEIVAGPAEHGPQPAVVGVLVEGEGLVIGLGGGDVLGDVHQHGAGAAGAGDGEGLPQHVGQGAGVLHQIVALGDGHGDTGDVHLLKGVLADEVLADVAGDEHHRGGVVVGRGDAGGQVGGPGAGGGEAHPHLSGGAGIAVGGVGGALLVGGEDMADFVLVAVELKFVVYVQDRAAGVAEDRVHPLLQKALHQNLGGFHSHRASEPPL